MHRFNGLVRGHFGDMPIIGFKTQFSMAYSDNFKYNFIQVDRGTGMNPSVDTEKVFMCISFMGPILSAHFLYSIHYLQNI